MAVTMIAASPGSLGPVELRDLHILHWRGDHVAVPNSSTPSGDVPNFQIDTCQRRVTILASAADRESLRERLPSDGELQSFEGIEAYAFLLRFACGLESKLVGETEIFGQIKQAWREYAAAAGALRQQLDPLIQQLFQDTKEIRARFLSGLGSASYGSQVRRILGDCGRGGPTLLIGSGQLAQAVAPWVECSELWISNRTPKRALELATEVRERHPARPCKVPDGSAQAELLAWREARDVVLCVPADQERDGQRIAAWLAAQPRPGRIIHLGAGGSAEGQWAQVPGLTSLSALFEMLRTQLDQRQRHVQRARHACAEKALLRSLGGSANQAHGWEDLAAFAALSA